MATQTSTHKTGITIIIFFMNTNIHFWIKDSKCRFVVINETMSKKHNGTDINDDIGVDDLSVTNKEQAEGYMKDDREVMETGKPLVNKIELVPNALGELLWYSTTKYPLFDKEGLCIGTYGYSINLNEMQNSVNPIMKMVPVINYIKENLSENLDINIIASIASLPVSKVESIFDRMFSTSFSDYIAKERIEVAEEYLNKAELSVPAIAEKCGFKDENEFREALKKFRKKTPEIYRVKATA